MLYELPYLLDLSGVPPPPPPKKGHGKAYGGIWRKYLIQESIREQSKSRYYSQIMRERQYNQIKEMLEMKRIQEMEQKFVEQESDDLFSILGI